MLRLILLAGVSPVLDASGPPTPVWLERVNGQLVRMPVSVMTGPATPAAQAETARFLDSLRQRFGRPTPGPSKGRAAPADPG